MTQYTPTDRFKELDLIDLEGVFSALGIYMNNMLPDMEACLVFLMRILKDEAAANHPKTREWLTHLVRKVRDLGPLDPKGLDLVHKLTGDPVLDARLERLNYFVLDPALTDLRGAMNDKRVMDRKRTLLMETLDRMPGHILAASLLLQLDYYQGIENGDWLEKLTIPKFFRDEWKQRLFLHHAALGNAENALPIWDTIREQPISEIQLNLAAELFANTGDTQAALRCYEQSLQFDPNQTPVRLRMEELASPTRPDADLPDKHSVAICLYSWNKADDLKRTLESLAATNIGPATIRVLLNGCTDHSLEVAEGARNLFPANHFEIITLPVNIGAPAARNWLGALPEVRASEFVAYIDDDVELPADWLAHFLTVMERHPDTTAVGAKVTHGFDPRLIQYLHRAFSVVTPDLIKLTDPCQLAMYDYGQYDYVRTTDCVMGCCHLLRMAHMPDGPQFDIRYSPSQIDDIAHDLMLRIKGGTVRYCGLVQCIHHQNTGSNYTKQADPAQLGQLHGNDLKLTAVLRQHEDRILEIMNNVES